MGVLDVSRSRSVMCWKRYCGFSTQVRCRLLESQRGYQPRLGSPRHRRLGHDCYAARPGSPRSNIFAGNSTFD